MAALLAFLLTGTLAAQFDVNGPNAILTIQDKTASVEDPADHDLSVFVPASLDLVICSNANPQQPVLLLASPVDPTGPTFPVPWGGSLDIGTPASPLPSQVDIIGDGINPVSTFDFFFVTSNGNALAGTLPSFELPIQAGINLDGLRIAFQAVVGDPSNPPFNLDMTEAADANFEAGQKLIVNPTSATASSPIAFLPGRVFNFHGAAYTDVYISAKGFVTFGAPSSYAPPGFNNDTVAFVNNQPGIAAFVADWANSGNGSNPVVYEEIGNSVRVAWGDPLVDPNGLPHFGGSDTNRFEVRFELQDPGMTNPFDGEFAVEVQQVDLMTASQPGDGIIGHTPGPNALAGGQDIDLHAQQTSAPGAPMVEEHDRTGTNIVIGWDGLGARRAYNNFKSWEGQAVTFVPNPPSQTVGDSGYTSTASMQAPADLQAISPTSLDVVGNQVITLVGKFHTFNDALGGGGTVTFEQGTATSTGTVIGIRDGTGLLAPNLPNNPAAGPFRDGEALDVSTPPFGALGFSTGPVNVRVDWFSGESITIPATITSPGVLVTSYNIAQVSSLDAISHPLSGNLTVSLYGQNYSTLHINQHGYINLGGAVRNFNEAVVDLFAGIPNTNGNGAGPASGGASVAVVWSDLISSANTQAFYEVTEDAGLGTVRVDWKNQDHWQSGNPAGEWSVTFGGFGPNSLEFDHSQFVADPSSSNTHDVVIGVTDGDPMTGTDRDFTPMTMPGTGLAAAIATGYATAPADAPESFGELIPQGTQPMLGIWTALDIGDGLTTPFGSWTLF